MLNTATTIRDRSFEAQLVTRRLRVQIPALPKQALNPDPAQIYSFSILMFQSWDFAVTVGLIGTEFLASLDNTNVTEGEAWLKLFALLLNRINSTLLKKTGCDSFVLSTDILVPLKLAENVPNLCSLDMFPVPKSPPGDLRAPKSTSSSCPGGYKIYQMLNQKEIFFFCIIESLRRYQLNNFC